MHTDVLPCLSICNHDVPYAIINIRVTRFAPRYKYIRNEKNLDNELFKQDFASLPLHFVYGFDSPDDMVDALNSLIKESIERHAPLRRVKVTCPPAPWLADLLIRDLQQKRDKLRKKAHETNDPDDWKDDCTKPFKTVIGQTKRSFLAKALSSKRPKETWKTTHRVLNPCPKLFRADPDDLNNFFNSTSERTQGNETAVNDIDLSELVENLSDGDQANFEMSEITHAEVPQEIKRLRSDCSTGADQIPVKFLKSVAEHLAGPLTHIINACIKLAYFPRAWKVARISPIPKVDQPKSDQDYRSISILPALSKILRDLYFSR